MVEFADLFESEAEEFQKKAKVGIPTLIVHCKTHLQWVHDLNLLSPRDGHMTIKAYSLQGEEWLGSQPSYSLHICFSLTIVYCFSQKRRSLR